MYPEELVKPMREDLASAGFEELHTSEAVNEALKKDGTTLVVVNSVCGCAAANARPAAKLSLQNSKTPNNLVTVLPVWIWKLLPQPETTWFPFLLPHQAWPCSKMVSWCT